MIRPDLTTIVVIGDVQPDEARHVIEKSIGSWTGSGSKPNVVLPPVPANQASAVTVSDPTALQDTVAQAQESGINRYNLDYFALQLGKPRSGGGFYATRLYHNQRQLTGYVITSMWDYKRRGLRSVCSVPCL